MNIGALDKITNIQTRINEIEQKITGFSTIFQAELQNVSNEEHAAEAVEATNQTNPADYTTLTALLNQNASFNSLLVDSANTSGANAVDSGTLQKVLLGNTDVNTAIETYLKNHYASGTGSSLNNVLGTTNQLDTLNLSNLLQGLVGQSTDEQK